MSFLAGLSGQRGISGSQADPENTQEQSASAPPVEAMESSTTIPDRGECRICFERGGDLIAPCLCDGTSKWIHRRCLDHWRVSGVNPRALTNCSSCNFQYHLKLKRILSDDGKERQRQFLQRLAGQTVLAFLGVQIAIIGFAILIRASDREEKLVKLLNLPQEQGYEEFSVGTFIDAFRHHKLTYYICGVVAFLAFIGLFVMSMGCASLCLGINRDNIPFRRRDDLCCGICMDACRCGSDCGICCEECCCAPCTGRCRCPGLPPLEFWGECSCNSAGEFFLVCALLVVLVAIVIGVIAALVALVMTVQQAVKRFATLEEMRILSQEYVVVDLANPDDGKDEMVICRAMGQDEQQAQREVVRDLNRIFASESVSSLPATGYGATDRLVFDSTTSAV